MKTEVNSMGALPDYTINSARRAGNTIRLVDHIIQLLFEDKVVTVLDHHQWGSSRQANENLMKMVLRRLSYEHSINDAIVKQSTNPAAQTIELKS